MQKHTHIHTIKLNDKTHFRRTHTHTHTHYSTLNAKSASMRKETSSAAVMHSGSVGEK